MAGRIIDDSVFTNKASIAADQIQAFFNAQVPNCDTNGTQPASEFGRPDITHAQYAALVGWQAPPYICLKNYTEGGKSAAQIIYDVAQTYSINPQVLIVLLQKEQSLVTDSWPINVPQYRSATGYGCPDTAACDSEYYGFGNQVTWAAKMFRAILNDSPTWYTPYELGNNYIQYNPNPSCGGSTVYIQNRATQALYNYTPYQPNESALNADWGTATCGAYGNRNFYLYFTRWFGATTSAATYSYSVVSKEFYSDYTYQTKLPDNPVVEPNQEFYAKIKIKNTGNQAWYSENLHLGTAGPLDRQSQFAANDWLGTNRPAAISESTVNGGETATFMFKMKAPAELGNYQETFGTLIEGYRWLDGTFSIPITVSSSSPYYAAKATSFKIYSDSSMTKELSLSNVNLYTRSKLYVKVVTKNTGNQILPADLTKIGTTNPNDRTSIYSDGSWLESDRPAKAQGGDIAPGETGVFTFSLTAPSTPQARSQEQFGLLIEGQSWLSQNVGIISLQTNQRPPEILQTNSALQIGESLLSKDERYQLILQGDGNLVLYSLGKAVWASWTVGRGGVKLIMQSDGNIVLYRADWIPIWNSRTSGKGPSTLIMQSDGNLVSYNSTNYTWASWTVGR
jgi:hypothetical protein